MIDIKSASTKELVAYYNAHAETPVKRFSDRKTAEKRVAALRPNDCPSCGVDMFENGWDLGRDGAIICMACNGGEKAKNPKHSRAIADSWANPETARKRAERNGVIAGGVEYKSVPAAFRANNLPMKKVIPFRMALKEAGTLTEFGMDWKIIRKGE